MCPDCHQITKTAEQKLVENDEVPENDKVAENDEEEVAVAAEAEGIHLEEVPAAEAERIHLEEVAAAAEAERIHLEEVAAAEVERIHLEEEAAAAEAERIHLEEEAAAEAECHFMDDDDDQDLQFATVGTLLLKGGDKVTLRTGGVSQTFVEHNFVTPSNKRTMSKTFIDKNLTEKLKLSHFDLLSAYVSSKQTVMYAKAIVKDASNSLFSVVCILRPKSTKPNLTVVLHNRTATDGQRFLRVRISAFNKLNMPW